MANNREPVAWITVKGRRVPIFEGESKADAVKRVIGGGKAGNGGKKTSDKSDHRTSMGPAEKEARELTGNEKGKLSKSEKFHIQMAEEKRRREEGIKTKYGSPDHSKLSQHSEIQKIAEAHNKKVWDVGAANKELYDEADKFAEKHHIPKEKVRKAAMQAFNEKYSVSLQRSRKIEALKKDGMNEEAAKRYLDNEEKADKLERELNTEMSSKESKHSVGWRREMQAKISQLRAENKELKYGHKPGETSKKEQTEEQKNIQKNEDDKERQIAANKKEAESKNEETVFGKTMEQNVQEYQDKFLKKRTDEQIEELRKNIANSKWQSVSDKIALEAIDREMKTRQQGAGVKEQTVFGKEANEKIEAYQNKFLKNKTPEQLEEIKKNLEKGGNITGYTPEDRIALAAIRREQESRQKGAGAKEQEKAAPTPAKTSTPQFKNQQEAEEYYREKFKNCSSTYRNKMAAKLGIEGRGQEKIDALAKAMAAKHVTSQNISKDEDTKEKQIAANKAEADRLNGKKYERKKKG